MLPSSNRNTLFVYDGFNGTLKGLGHPSFDFKAHKSIIVNDSLIVFSGWPLIAYEYIDGRTVRAKIAKADTREAFALACY